ncbi:MAG TPA: PspC domain-containing protein [Thermoanaerobaculia bacterium]|jgi:phage shock protein PspC (stress-responsive transcriptional regulator)
MNCNDAIAALVASLEQGTPMTDEQREHIRTCPRCSAILGSAKEAMAAEPRDVLIDGTVAAAEQEVRRKRFWRGVRVYLGVLLVAFTAVVSLLTWSEMKFLDAMAFTGIGVAIAILVTGPVLLLIWFIRGAGGRRRLYRRLGAPRLLFGVCAGLAEAWKADVTMLRVAFVLLLVINGAGFWLYVLCALVMPVHPDDRRHLLRFRWRRWLARRTPDAEHHAG